jgi:SNF2 family DNA or RNA helicase
MLRRLKKDVLTELPPKLYENIHVEFSEKERALYRAIQEETMNELKEAGMLSRNNLSQALVKIVRLKQMANSCELINGEQTSAKLTELKEQLKTILANGEKALIFTTFKEMALILMRELVEYNPLLIAGGVSENERNENRKMFNEDDIHRLLIMTEAGNRGLNLQRADAVIHYDLPWSIATAEQREDRAHRHGHVGNMTVYRMLVDNSVDEYILQVLFKKARMADVVLGDSDSDEIAKSNITEAEVLQMLTAN